MSGVPVRHDLPGAEGSRLEGAVGVVAEQATSHPSHGQSQSHTQSVQPIHVTVALAR